MDRWVQQLLCTWLQSLSISLLRCWSWLATQRSKGETSSAVGNSQRWRAGHFDQGNHCWRGCDPGHSKIPHQQVFKEGPKELGFWFLWSNAKKGWRVLYASLHFTTWCNYQPREQRCIPNSCHHLCSTFFLDEELELDTKKNRSSRLIAQVYQGCTMVVMCMRGSWESHHLDIAMSAVLGIHKHTQD